MTGIPHAGTVCNKPDAAAPPSTDYVLSELRRASLHARLWQADIEAIALALAGGVITAQEAIDHLAECDLLPLIEAAQP
jgi:hypothetical protein